MALTAPKTVATATSAVVEEQMTAEGIEAVANSQHTTVNSDVQTTANAQMQETAVESVEAFAAETQAFSTTAVVESRPTEVAVARPAVPAFNPEQQFEDEGFSGLSIGGMSFDQIRLPGEGQFLMGQEDIELGKEFDCVIKTSRSRYVVRQSSEEDSPIFYSYDPAGQTDTEGNSRADTLAEWAAEGYGEPIIKKYLEIMAIMVDRDAEGNAGERDGHMVILSVSPSSIQRFSGYLFQTKMMTRKAPNEVITRCMVAAKVKKGSNSFFPWAFKAVGPAPVEYV